ncbi:MAG: hypothetical protein R3D26_04420 [Cyanobacteriota/Melainabacteria group bacterium]
MADRTVMKTGSMAERSSSGIVASLSRHFLIYFAEKWLGIEIGSRYNILQKLSSQSTFKVAYRRNLKGCF